MSLAIEKFIKIEKFEVQENDKKNNLYVFNKLTVENGKSVSTIYLKPMDDNIYLYFDNSIKDTVVEKNIIKALKNSKISGSKTNDANLISLIQEKIIDIQKDTLTQKNVSIKTKKDENEYGKFVDISVKKTSFNSILNEKYAGYTFIIKNNYTEPFAINDVSLYNNLSAADAFRNTAKSSTALSFGLSFWGGLCSFITFGISLALLPAAIADLARYNVPAQKEAEKFLKNQNMVTSIQPGESIELRAIATRSENIINKAPYINLNLINTKTEKLFSINNEPALNKL